MQACDQWSFDTHEEARMHPYLAPGPWAGNRPLRLPSLAPRSAVADYADPSGMNRLGYRGIMG